MKGLLLASFLVISAHAAYQVDVPGHGLKHHQILTTFEEEVRDKIHNHLIAKVNSLSTFIQNHWNAKSAEYGAKLESTLDVYRLQLDKLQPQVPPHCIEGAHERVEEVKHGAVWEFFHCHNISDAFLDIGSIIAKSVFLTADLFRESDEIYTKVRSCFSINPFTSIPCFIKTVSLVKDEFRDMYATVANYSRDVHALAKDIHDDFDYCFHDHEDAAKKAQNVVDDVKKCAEKHKVDDGSKGAKPVVPDTHKNDEKNVLEGGKQGALPEAAKLKQAKEVLIDTLNIYNDY